MLINTLRYASLNLMNGCFIVLIMNQSLFFPELITIKQFSYVLGIVFFFECVKELVNGLIYDLRSVRASNTHRLSVFWFRILLFLVIMLYTVNLWGTESLYPVLIPVAWIAYSTAYGLTYIPFYTLVNKYKDNRQRALMITTRSFFTIVGIIAGTLLAAFFIKSYGIVTGVNALIVTIGLVMMSVLWQYKKVSYKFQDLGLTIGKRRGTYSPFKWFSEGKEKLLNIKFKKISIRREFILLLILEFTYMISMGIMLNQLGFYAKHVLNNAWHTNVIGIALTLGAITGISLYGYCTNKYKRVSQTKILFTWISCSQLLQAGLLFTGYVVGHDTSLWFVCVFGYILGVLVGNEIPPIQATFYNLIKELKSYDVQNVLQSSMIVMTKTGLALSAFMATTILSVTSISDDQLNTYAILGTLFLIPMFLKLTGFVLCLILRRVCPEVSEA